MSEGTIPRWRCPQPDPAQGLERRSRALALRSMSRQRLARVRQFIAQSCHDPAHALLNEVGQQQRQRDTKHNHDHRRHAGPQV
jgi:hypothetical protein